MALNANILCVGECLIDMLPATTAEGDAALRPVPGGAVMNTAVGLGRLDLSTALPNFLSAEGG